MGTERERKGETEGGRGGDRKEGVKGLSILFLLGVDTDDKKRDNHWLTECHAVISSAGTHSSR